MLDDLIKCKLAIEAIKRLKRYDKDNCITIDVDKLADIFLAYEITEVYPMIK